MGRLIDVVELRFGRVEWAHTSRRRPHKIPMGDPINIRAITRAGLFRGAISLARVRRYIIISPAASSNL